MTDEILARLFRVWSQSPETCTLNKGASEEELRRAEDHLGFELPEEVRWLYSRCNGAYLFGGDVQLYPLETEDEFSVTRVADALREWEWPVPENVLVFGSDGCGDSFGLWLSSATRAVVQIGAIFESNSLGVVGTSLSRFLLGRSAYYAQLSESSAEVIAGLGLPAELVVGSEGAVDFDDEGFERMAVWADPGLELEKADPYSARLTPSEVEELLG